MRIDAESKPASLRGQPETPDVSPEAIAALVARGAAILSEEEEESPDAVAAVARGTRHSVRESSALEVLIGVTHDMRSPLSSMMVIVEQLRNGSSGPLTRVQERQLGLLYGAIFGLVAMTNDALDFARGGASLERKTAFSITDLLRSVVRIVQPIAEERGLFLRMTGPDADTRYGRPNILYRVLLNLVTNALKNTDSGTVTISAVATDIDLVTFYVDDNGRGMPYDVLSKRSLDTPSGCPPNGGREAHGLGLLLCDRLLAEIESNLEFENLGTGGTRATFGVRLGNAEAEI